MVIVTKSEVVDRRDEKISGKEWIFIGEKSGLYGRMMLTGRIKNFCGVGILAGSTTIDLDVCEV